MILILSRLVDSDKFKKMTNWPHCSPVRSTFVPPKEGELTYKDALPMQIDLPGKDPKYHGVHGPWYGPLSCLDINQYLLIGTIPAKRKRPEAAWRIKENAELRTRVMEYCKDQQKQYTNLKIQQILGKIKRIGNREEYNLIT